MPKEDWVQNTVDKIFRDQNLWPWKKIDSILDVACGLSFKSQYMEADVRVGVDIYRPYLEKIEAKVPHSVVCADVMRLDELFLPKSFDIVLLLDIVEHLEKDQSLRLIQMAEKVARKGVIIETPEGFIPQDIDIWGHGGDEFQTHRCGWEKKELEDMGYHIVRRPYRMSNVQRHTKIKDIPLDIHLLDAIKLLES